MRDYETKTVTGSEIKGYVAVGFALGLVVGYLAGFWNML